MLIDKLNRIEEGIISLLLVTMTLFVFIEVILRFVFNTGVHWSTEFTENLGAWFVLFGASYGIKIGSHIGVDAVVKLLPSKIHRIVSVIAILLCLVYCALFLFGSWEYLTKVWELEIGLEDVPPPHWVNVLGSYITGADINDMPETIPLWFAHGMLLVGFTFIAIRLVMLLRGVIIGTAEGFTFMNEAKETMHLAEHETQQESGESKA